MTQPAPASCSGSAGRHGLQYMARDFRKELHSLGITARPSSSNRGRYTTGFGVGGRASRMTVPVRDSESGDHGLRQQADCGQVVARFRVPQYAVAPCGSKASIAEARSAGLALTKLLWISLARC